MAILLFFVSTLVLSTLERVRYQPRADEGFYLSYAARVAHEGPPAIRRLMEGYVQAAPTARYFPNPLRLTTIFLGAAAVRLGGGYFTTLSLLSLAAFLALLAVMFVGVRRAFGGQTACWTAVLLGVAPLHLAMARRALSDTLVSAFLLSCLWLFRWALSRPAPSWAGALGRRWWMVSAAYGAAFLVKESALLLIPISLAFLGWDWMRRRREPIPWWPICAVSALPLALAGLALVAAGGGPELAWKTAQAFGSGAQANAYAQQYQQGPWFRYVVDLMLISPWPVLLYGVWLGVLVGGRIRHEEAWFWALIPILFLAAVAPFPAGKNVRFVLFLEAPIRLCTVLLLQRLWGERGLLSRIGLAGTVLCIAWMDLAAFHRLFVAGGIYDPISLSLLELRRFLPG